MLASTFDESGFSQSSILNLDSVGDTIWSLKQALFPDSIVDFINKIIKTDDSCFVTIGGNSRSNVVGASGIRITKLDVNRNIHWSKVIQIHDSMNLNYSGPYMNVIQTNDRGFAVFGETDQMGWHGTFLLKLDSVGNPEWINTFSINHWIHPTNILFQDRDSSFLLICGTGGGLTVTNQGSILLKTDKLGNLLFTLTSDSNQTHGLNGLCMFNNKYYLSTSYGLFQSNLVPGNYQVTGFDIGISSVMTSFNQLNDSLVIISYNSSNGTNSESGFLCLDSLGELKMIKQFNTARWIESVIQNDKKEFIIHTFNFGPLYSEEIIKTDSMGDNSCLSSIPNAIDTINFQITLLNYPVTSKRCSLSVSSLSFGNSNGGSIIDICLQNKINDFTPSKLQIFPNPTFGEIHLQSDFSIRYLYLVDVFGKIIFRSLNSDHLNLTSIPKGIYFLIAELSDASTQITKVLIQ
jgi:hypothetical protein